MAATTAEDLTAGARTVLRDFPLYFEVEVGPLNTLTIRLPHPLIMSSSLQVYLTPAPTVSVPEPVTVLTSAWQLDDRNGLLKLTEAADLGKRCLVSGYHYTWFSDSDLGFHVSKVVNEMTHSGTCTFNNFLPVQYDVIMLGGVIQALWSLAMELSLDIDVSTPEGMFIPARQRLHPGSADAAELRSAVPRQGGHAQHGPRSAGNLPAAPGGLHDRTLRAGLPGSGV